MDQTRPDVSVCLCTYHTQEHPRAQWLLGCIKSILDQKDVSIELLILDNGSTWEVSEILRSITDPRVKTARLPENQSIGTWSRLAEASSGRYICFFCDDDEMMPGCLAEQVSVLEESGAGLSVPFEMDPEDANFESLFLRCFIPFSGTVFDSRFKYLAEDSMTNVCGDWAFWLEIANTDPSVMIVTKPGLVKTRIHSGSDTGERGFGKCAFVEAHLSIWSYWINSRAYVPDEQSIWSMIHHFQWFLSHSKCTEAQKWGYMGRLRRLLFDINEAPEPSF